MRIRHPRPATKARREIVAAIIGAEVGTSIGMVALLLGGTALVPLALAATGAAIGAGAVHLRTLMLRRWLRAQLRGSA
jgi:hypothetical protein